MLFLALGAVVLSFGLVAGNGDAFERTRSFSDIASSSARLQARNLAAEAQVLAAASQGGRADEFRAQAEGLRTQAALLTVPGREPASGSARNGSVEDLAGTREASGAGGPGENAAAADRDEEAGRRHTERYVRALWESAQTNLHSAWRADGGTARLLAATGAAQQIWAVRIADLSGVALPGPVPAGPGPAPDAAEEVPDSADSPDAAGSSRPRNTGSCPAGRTPDPAPASAPAAAAAPAGPDAAAALTSVINAELGTAYAYQVALAQADPGRETAADWRTQVAGHEARGSDAVSFLADLCLPQVAPVAAYRLDPEFLGDPAGSLPDLEEQFPGVYADLVALSDGDLRGWAITRLAAISTDLYRHADTVPAAPGLDAVPDKLPWT